LDLRSLERLVARPAPPPWKGVLLGLACAGLAAALRAVLHPLAPEAAPFAPFLVATLLATLFGGVLAGSVSLVAGTLTGWYFFLPPFGSWDVTPVVTVSLALAASTQVVLVMLGGLVRRALRRSAEAESALGANEARLRAIFDGLPAAAFVVEAPEGEVSLRSLRTAALLPGADPLACPATGADGSALSRGAHPALRALTTGEAVEGEMLRVPDPAGGERLLEVFARPVRDDAGRIAAAVCAAFDVSARQAAEEAWQRKAHELEAVMALAPVGVWFTYDQEVRHVMRNRFAAELLRASADSTASIAGDGPARLEHVTLWRDGRRLTREEMPLQRALRGEESQDEEVEAVFADGSRIMLVSNARPLRDAAGRVIGAVSASLDITARKQAETALRDAIAQREMLQREADHRIKNSLQIVSSVLRLQRGRVSDPAAIAILDETIARIAAVAEAHAALHKSADLTRVDVGIMVGDLARHVGALNPEVAIRCAVEESPTLDAQRAIPLGLMVSELLTNALRHAYPPGEPGEVVVRVTGRPEMLEVEVRDNGIGIADRPGHKGSLGAALVQSFAARIGATVETRSAAGQGTTVLLRLDPAEPAASAA
jgi:two-component sensor histidine kinase/PAS domain-containing protein